MRPSALPRLAVWALCLAALATLTAQRLELSYDLGLFLPAPQTPAQTLLVERLGEAPGSRFVLLAVPDEPARLRALIDELEGAPAIARVLSDLQAPADKPPEPLFTYRYLLSDTDWTVSGLQAALEQRLAELGLGTDQAFEELVAADPTLSSLDLVGRLTPGSGQAWLTQDGRRVLIAETRAPTFALDAQAAAIGQVKSAIEAHYGTGAAVTLSGAGVFGVALRDTIEAEARGRTLLASGALIAVLLLMYRSVRVLLLAALPLLTGVLTGAAAVSLAFDAVHGITLAFGFTLLGVAIDYPLHYLSRARLEAPQRALRATWPTLRLSALSTMLAYAALMVGGAEGMAQLGLFSAAGVAGALLTTRFLLPWLSPDGHGAGTPGKSEGTGAAEANAAGPGGVSLTGQKHDRTRLRFSVIAVLLAGGLALTWLGGAQPWWSSNLAALSPVPAERLAEERALRQATGAPSIRYLVTSPGTDLDSALRVSENSAEALKIAVARGLIEGFSDPGALLPSSERQLKRQAAIPDAATLAARLTRAAEGTPLAPAAFQPFLDAAENSRQLEPLRAADYANSALEPVLAAQIHQGARPADTAPKDRMVESRGQDTTDVADVAGMAGMADKQGSWSTLTTLRGITDPVALEALLADLAPDARLLDLRAASESLVTDYRKRLLGVLGAVTLLLAVLLTWRLRPVRAAWTVLLVGSAVAFSAAALRWLSGPLDLYQLTGLLLVAGIGLDYALFLGKGDRRAAGHAVFACMASTVAAFGVLAASLIPALNSLGSTVALGSAVCFTAAWLGSRDAGRGGGS